MIALAYMLQNYGFISTIWLIGTVWAMDTGAYLFGKTIGGPKMCPVISPKKTWAGLFGGMLTAAAWGAGCAKFGNVAAYEQVMIVSAILGAVSQGGDLFESWIKRYLGVKDSSNLIPGHGGIFDRMDALLAVAPIVVIIMTFCPGLNFWG
jgi:phosphatidate cytidylyltransferase